MNPRKTPSPLLIETMQNSRDAITDSEDYENIYQFATPAEIEGIINLDKFNPNARNKNGDTVLHVAASAGHFEIIKWLVEAGAAIDEPNAKNITPLFIAAQSAIEIIKNAEKDIDHTDDLLKNAYLNIVKYLAEKGANTHYQEENIKALLSEFVDTQAQVTSANDKRPSFSSFYGQTKAKAICEQLNRISGPLNLSWGYCNTLKMAFILTQNVDEDHLENLLDHFKVNEIAIPKNSYYKGILTFNIADPKVAQLKEIPALQPIQVYQLGK